MSGLLGQNGNKGVITGRSLVNSGIINLQFYEMKQFLHKMM
jgi:hypothetical protein